MSKKSPKLQVIRTPLLLIFYSFLVSTVISGCGIGIRGPEFAPVNSIPRGQALVYIYRPAQFLGGGVAYLLTEGGDPVAHIYPGGYFPYFVQPGKRIFICEGTRQSLMVVLDVTAGSTYYIKQWTIIGGNGPLPRMEKVDASTAEEEIQKCRLIELDKKPFGWS